MARGQKAAAADMEKILDKLGKLDIVEGKLGKLDKLEDKLDDLQKGQTEIKSEIAAITKDLNAVQKATEENKKRVEGLEGEVRVVRRREEVKAGEMLALQLDKMSYFLRFQNLEETDREDLRDVMVNLLGEYLGRSLDFLSWDMDQIYRVNSQYATIHGVPREVHVKFVRRETRDEILRKQRAGALTYRGKEVNILKQIPRQVRELRRKYYFLANRLYHKGIGFRWLIPEGLLIFQEGMRKKIGTVEEAKAYMEEHKLLLDAGDAGTEEGEVLEDQEAGVGEAVAVPRGDQAEARTLRSRTRK